MGNRQDALPLEHKNEIITTSLFPPDSGGTDSALSRIRVVVFTYQSKP